MAQDLSSSLDLGHVLDSTVARLRSFWDLSALAVLVPDETSDRWLTVRQEGARLPFLLAADALPSPLLAAVERAAVTSLSATGGGPGTQALLDSARSGIYAPLEAQGRLVGLLALEHDDPDAFGPSDVRLLEGLTATVGLAIENARAFERLRTVGADAERTRIASDLHDRVGQSLASLGFELDRLRKHSPDDELRPGIDLVRAELRAAMGEIRDTLYDLRTDVSEHQGLDRVLESFVARVRGRTEVAVHLDIGGEVVRLPLSQERELWRIAQEAITNAERHAHATSITVRWRCDGARAALEVADDGRGFDVEAASSSPGRYGLAGMRARAASIGARLDVSSSPEGGTLVRCGLGAP